MDIRNRNELIQRARHALARGRDPQKLVTYYAGANGLTALLLTVANFALLQSYDGTGGLRNLGTQSILSTIETLLPVVQAFLLLSLEFGYLYGMLRIARGQYADHTDLKVGFQKFGPILRLSMIQGLIYFGVGMLAFFLSMQVFLLSPWGEPVISLLMPFVTSGNPIIDDATAMQATNLMTPMLVMFGIIYLAVVIPLLFRFRMANYALMDNPRAGAMAALRESWRMMRKNCLNLLKLDLRFWWYYLVTALIRVIAYADVILEALGISLPFSATANAFLFYGMYLITLFLVNYYLRNLVECTYVQAYEAIRPRKEEEGIVLGSIFDV